MTYSKNINLIEIEYQEQLSKLKEICEKLKTSSSLFKIISRI